MRESRVLLALTAILVANVSPAEQVDQKVDRSWFGSMGFQ